LKPCRPLTTPRRAPALAKPGPDLDPMLTKEEISQEIPRKKIPNPKRCSDVMQRCDTTPEYFVNLLQKTTKNSLSLQTQVVLKK
jgi:hypothetical protein